LRSDNGPEFVSTRLLQWASDQGLQLALSQPGKPWQNGTDESFNGKFRDECLSMEYFRNRMEARVVIEQWRCHCNEVRPHSALRYPPSAVRSEPVRPQPRSPSSQVIRSLEKRGGSVP
jgi:putative transposase